MTRLIVSEETANTEKVYRSHETGNHCRRYSMCPPGLLCQGGFEYVSPNIPPNIKKDRSNKPTEVQTVTGEICNTATNGASDDDSDEEAESPTTAAPASPTAGNVVVATTECVTTSTIHANGSAPTATSSAAPEEFTGAAGSVRVAAGMLFGAGAAVAAAIL